MKIKSYCVLFMFMFTFAVSCFAQGTPYELGPYTVFVDVRTSTGLIIPYAKVKCRKWWDIIKVSVNVPGYVFASKEIPVIEGLKKYYATFYLKDKKATFEVRDYDFKVIASAYFENNQTNVPTDKFLITLFIPKKIWPHPSPSNIRVMQEGYGIPIQETCDISTRDAFYCIKMRIMREFLDGKDPKILILINTEKNISKNSAFKWLKQIEYLEKGNLIQKISANCLARQLYNFLPQDIDIQELPKSIKTLQNLQNKFNNLHKVHIIK